MSENEKSGFQRGLFWVFVLCTAAVAALYLLVRPADLSSDGNVTNWVQVLAVTSIAIVIITASQILSLPPTQREAVRPFGWALLAASLAAAIIVPLVILVWGYASSAALILLAALVIVELIVFVKLVLSRFAAALAEYAVQQPLPPMAPPAQAQVIPPVQLAPEEVARYEEATLALEQATRDQEEATREADELAQRYEQALQAYGAQPPQR